MTRINLKIWTTKPYIRDSIACVGFAFLFWQIIIQRTAPWWYLLIAIPAAIAFLTSDTMDGSSAWHPKGINSVSYPVTFNGVPGRVKGKTIYVRRWICCRNCSHKHLYPVTAWLCCWTFHLLRR